MLKPPAPSIPGMTDTLDFVKNLWGSMNLPGTNMSGMSTPPLFLLDPLPPGDSIELTRTEFSLLELFMLNPRQVLTRSVIFERVWGYDFGYGSNSLDVYIGYLRRKTEAGGKPRLIQTVRGVGYALREPA